MRGLQHCALLRGINVGGGNPIKMASLKACLESAGIENVATYIQSGNVLFESPESDGVKLARRLEKTLSKAFKPYRARVVVCAQDTLEKIVKSAPKGFGRKPETYRYDVIYLMDDVTPAAAIEHVVTRPGVDEAHTGPGVLYFSRLIARASQSRLTRIIGLPIYQQMTIRNWNTTTKLLALMDGRQHTRD
jgi:uncharacterized protein (DUF1697 family)